MSQNIKEVIELLKENDFQEINDDNIEEMENVYSIGQLLNEIKEPIGIKGLFEMLNSLGMITYQFEELLPNQPDKVLFTQGIKNVDEITIVPLFKKSVLDDLKDIMKDNEYFIDFMNKKNNEAYENAKNSIKKITLNVISDNPSPKKGKIIGTALMLFSNMGIKKQEINYWHNQWTEKELLAYQTPKIEGKKSNYDYLQVNLPGMDNVEYDFYAPIVNLRRVYSFCDKADIFLENEEQLEFLNIAFEKEGLPYKIEDICNSIINIKSLSKKITNEYKTVQDIVFEEKIETNLDYSLYGKTYKQMRATMALLNKLT